MVDLCINSLYGFGSVDSLLNMKIYELYALKQAIKDDTVRDVFKKIKIHNFD